MFDLSFHLSEWVAHATGEQLMETAESRHRQAEIARYGVAGIETPLPCPVRRLGQSGATRYFTG
ncbi:MAG: hypothetical protein AAF674_20945 [Pseudomonadota bacterium]